MSDARYIVSVVRLVVALSIAVFVALSIWVATGNSAAFDLAGIHAIQSFRTAALDEAVAYFTLFGSTPGVILAILLTAAWAFHRDRRLARSVVAVGIVDELSYPILKLIFQRDRPLELATVFLPTTFSFPSGHAVAAAAVYGMLAYTFARLYPRLRTPLAIIAPLFILALGLSRPYLGVHWPTDVVAGFALGTLILVGGIRLSRDPRRKTAEPNVRQNGRRSSPDDV